ncbi:MAG: glycoside hydrolase family 88 protein [Defluviitaleaceae bacterium]|nr:glycoside hydrolase family 88 protein [Defluviitaleaceae bacterium]MCL2239721.1 glycoside hydrolase family 88 protein [Defluviitaleaceae bacterium]
MTHLHEAIDRVVKRTMRMDLTWDWPCGVAYYGICEAYNATGNTEYLDLLKARIDEYRELGLPKVWTVNTCAMGHAMLTLHEATGDDAYMDIALSKLDYLRNHALRFADNVLQHTVSAKNDFPEQAWADTLFMAAFFMLRLGVKRGDEALINDALNQYYWHIKYLQDPDTGLWYHGYEHINKSHMSGFFWARANAWAAYTMSQVGHYLPEAYLYPKFMDVAGSVNEQLSALKLLQTPEGLWRTLLDDPESYEEISASCGIAAAMAARGNPLHRKYVQRALDGVLKNIAPDGRVRNVSGGTAIMKDREGYRQISRDWIQGWGQGLALTFLSAAVRAEDFRSDGAL